MKASSCTDQPARPGWINPLFLLVDTPFPSSFPAHAKLSKRPLFIVIVIMTGYARCSLLVML